MLCFADGQGWRLVQLPVRGHPARRQLAPPGGRRRLPALARLPGAPLRVAPARARVRTAHARPALQRHRHLRLHLQRDDGHLVHGQLDQGASLRGRRPTFVEADWSRVHADHSVVQVCLAVSADASGGQHSAVQGQASGEHHGSEEHQIRSKGRFKLRIGILRLD